MDWSTFWLIFLQITIYAFAFPFLCLPVGIGLSFLYRRFRRTPTDELIVYGANRDDL